MRKYLSNRERILLHLSTYPGSINYYNAPFALTQDGIAQAIGIGRNNVPRELKILIKEGLIEDKKARVSGLKNRRTVYILTAKGAVEASNIKKKVMDLYVKVKNPDGEESTIQLRDIGKKYGVDSLSAALNLTKSMEIDLISLVRKKGRKVHYIEENYIITRFYGRKKEMEELENWYKGSKRILLLTGLPGIGKTTLMLKFIKEYLKDEDVFFANIDSSTGALDMLNKLSKFLSRTGYPKLERYLRGKFNGIENTIEWSTIHLILRESMDKGIYIFDNLENASENLKKFFRVVLDITSGANGIRMIFIGTGSGDFIPIRRMNDVKEFHLSELSEEDSFTMLRDLGLSEREAYRFLKNYGGNPLLLSLAKNHDQRVIRRFVLDVVLANLTDREREALEFVSVFRKPVKIAALLLNNIEYPVVYSLINRNILREMKFEVVTLHRIIRNFIYERLTDAKKKSYHIMAANYLMEEGDVLGAIHHFIHGDKILRAGMLLHDYHEKYLLEKPGEVRELALEILNSYERGIEDHEWLIMGIVGDTYKVEGSWDMAMEYYRKAEEVSRRRDVDYWARLRIQMGEICAKRGEKSKAREILGYVEEREGEISDKKTIARLNYVYGMVNILEGNLEEAEEYLMRGYRITEQNMDYLHMGSIFNGLGILYEKQKDYKMALEYFTRALEYFDVVDDKLGKVKVLHNIGKIYYEMYDKKAEKYFLEARAILDKTSDEYLLAQNSKHLGVFYLWNEKWNTAEKYLKMAEQKMKYMDLKSTLAELYIALGDLYYYTNRKEKGREYFDAAIQLAREIGNNRILKIAAQEILNTLGELSEEERRKYEKIASGEEIIVSLIEK